ncbi:type I-E CRISPR-associated protein Cas6/Cse3/CasE [Pseudoflavonifractor sp. MSJ-30]|nr:type I-E CRISPR-associated protein Cas6/Cse3/CasE [Pseudoflavonifractor sp. MSJ-30]
MRLDINNRRTLSALASPAKFHGAVESAFSGQRQRNLWRIDSRGAQNYLLILSGEKPDITQAVQQFAPPGETWQTKDYTQLLNRISQGSRWQFRLCANPTYSVPAGPGQRGRVCAHSTPEHQAAWLERQSERHGFVLKKDEFAVMKSVWYRFRKGNTGKNVTFLAVTYEGYLEVRDPELFCRMLCSGIGHGKAYGAGLMTLVRAEK